LYGSNPFAESNPCGTGTEEKGLVTAGAEEEKNGAGEKKKKRKKNWAEQSGHLIRRQI
jgi:hypothetical protein